jgi:hypothetical protein
MYIFFIMELYIFLLLDLIMVFNFHYVLHDKKLFDKNIDELD